MSVRITIVLLLFSISFVRAQSQPDSLKALLKGSLPDTTRINILNQLASQSFYKNPLETDSLASLAIRLAQPISYTTGLAQAHRFRGISHAIRGNFDEARQNYLDALEYLQDPNDEKDRAGLFYAIGITYAETGQYDKAVDSYTQALTIQKNNEDLNGVANTYVGLGNFYKKISQFDKSIAYLDSAATLYQELSMPSEIAIVRNNQANVYMSIDNYPKALESIQQALAYNEAEKLDQRIAINLHTIGAIYTHLGELDKAGTFYRRSYEMKEELGMVQGMVLTLSNLGSLLITQERYDSAKATFLRVRSIYDSTNLTCNLPYADLNLGVIHQTTGNKDSAYFYLNNALNVAKTCQLDEVTVNALIHLGELHLQDSRRAAAVKNFEEALTISRDASLVALQVDAASQLYTYYKGSDAAKALYFLEQSEQLKDSLYNEENNRKIARLESKYRFEQERVLMAEEFEQQRLVQENRVNQEKLIRNTVLIVAILLLALMIVISLFYLKIRQKNKLLTFQYEKIAEQNKRQLELNKTNEKLLALLSHDLRSPLHGMLSVLSLWKDASLTEEEIQQISEDVELRIGNLIQFMDNILSWSRSHFASIEPNKGPINLNRAVEETIRLLQPVAQGKNITIRYTLKDELILSADEAMLKTVFRNILSNSIKFSHPGSFIDIGITLAAGEVMISFKDYGVGISPEVKEKLFRHEMVSKEGTTNEMGAGLGLFLSQDFVDMHNGTIEILSEEGKGSEFIIHIPKQPED